MAFGEPWQKFWPFGRRSVAFVEVLACFSWNSVGWILASKSALEWRFWRSFGWQVRPGTAVSHAFGRQVGPGMAVCGALGRQVGPGMTVWRLLFRCFFENGDFLKIVLSLWWEHSFQGSDRPKIGPVSALDVKLALK